MLAIMKWLSVPVSIQVSSNCIIKVPLWAASFMTSFLSLLTWSTLSQYQESWPQILTGCHSAPLQRPFVSSSTLARSQNFFFHFWVWGALIITDEHKPLLTASSPSFNITLIFHLWLLIQSLIINKHSVNVAIIASSPRLDYLWHPSFTITSTRKRGEWRRVSIQYGRSVCVCVCVSVCVFACVRKLV